MDEDNLKMPDAEESTWRLLCSLNRHLVGHCDIQEARLDGPDPAEVVLMFLPFMRLSPLSVSSSKQKIRPPVLLDLLSWAAACFPLPTINPAILTASTSGTHLGLFVNQPVNRRCDGSQM